MLSRYDMMASFDIVVVRCGNRLLHGLISQFKNFDRAWEVFDEIRGEGHQGI